MTHTPAADCSPGGRAHHTAARRAPWRSAPWHACAAALALAMVQAPAAAERVFFDDFNSEAGGDTALFQQSLTNWSVVGAVDVIGTNNALGYTVPSTMIDLGGGLSGGFITTLDRFAFEAENVVTISWDMSGNQIRAAGEDIPYLQFYFDQVNEERYQEVRFLRGTEFYSWVDYTATGDEPLRIFDEFFAYSYGLFGDYPLTRQSISFHAVNAGAFRFQLGTYSGGGYGPLIDNFAVDITAVPEPATWALLLAGFAFIGARLQQRRGPLAAA